MTKSKRYEDMPITAPQLANRIVNYLQEHKYEVAYSYDEKHKTWCLIQARKFGGLRTATGNRRSLNVALRTKKKNECTISIGTGEWGKNTIMSAWPMMVFPIVGFMNFAGSAVSSKMSEADLWQFIESIANRNFYS